VPPTPRRPRQKSHFLHPCYTTVDHEIETRQASLFKLQTLMSWSLRAGQADITYINKLPPLFECPKCATIHNITKLFFPRFLRNSSSHIFVIVYRIPFIVFVVKFLQPACKNVRKTKRRMSLNIAAFLSIIQERMINSHFNCHIL